MTDAAAHVYRAFDASGRLLYVGCTNDLELRLRAHSQSSPWWIFHDRVDSVPYGTRAEAESAETTAIATEHPRWNRRGRSGPPAQRLDYDRDVQLRHRKLVDEEQRLVHSLRKVRMGLQGVRLEAEAIKNGFVLDDEDGAA